jgi:hypothetical protein
VTTIAAALALPSPLIVLARDAAAGEQSVLRLRIDAFPVRRPATGCIFAIRTPVVGGGTQMTCLQSIDRPPAPNARMHSRATTTFTLPGGILRARVRIVQRFEADGLHATQTTEGSIVGGTGQYRNARGSIRGHGSVVDRRDSLGRVHLSYVINLL